MKIKILTHDQFEKERAKQLKIIGDQIVGRTLPSGRNKLKVYPVEAGIGKTTVMVDAIMELHGKHPDIKTLIVTKFIEEARRLEKELGEICIAVYSGCKDKYSDEEICNIPVLIITHAKYIKICKGTREAQSYWDLYSCGRKNLIIDEELIVMEKVSLNEDEFQATRNTFLEIDCGYRELFDKAFSKLRDVFRLIHKTEPAHDMVRNIQPISSDSKASLDKVVRRAEKTRSNYDLYEMLAGYNDNDDLYWGCYDDIKMALKKMQILLNSSLWIYNRRGICCLDHTSYRLLENNIILDASACMNPIYSSGSLFEMVPMRRIVDHSNWTIYVCRVNSSASKKPEYLDYYDSVRLQMIKICQDTKNRLLVVGSKRDVELIQRRSPELLKEYEHQISIRNFGNIRGKNDWRNFNCCLIIHTFYLPSYLYPLKFIYYFPGCTLKSSDLVMRNNTGKGDRVHFGFVNHGLLDKVREGMLAAAVYQAIKRINRSNNMETQVYLVTNNINMLYALRKNMIGAKFKKFRLPNQGQLIEKKARTYKRKEESIYISRLKALFSEMSEGRYMKYECPEMPSYYTKEWCKTRIGYSGKNFGRFLNKLEGYMIENQIGKTQHKIIAAKHTEKDSS